MTAKHQKNTTKIKDLGAIQRDHPKCDTTMPRRNRNEYHRAFQQRQRDARKVDPQWQADRSTDDRWESDHGRGEHVVYLHHGRVEWCHVRDLPDGATVLLTALSWCDAVRIAPAAKEIIGQQPRPWLPKVGVVAVSADGSVDYYPSISSAARSAGVHRRALDRHLLEWGSGCSDSAGCAECRGYSGTTDWRDFSGRADYRGCAWLRWCRCP